jgi:hypothetical protein
MDFYSDKNCWEIINCDHLDCPARKEPETPCWQIAKRVGSFRDFSNTCRACIVYLIKNEVSETIKNELVEIMNQRGHSDKIGTGYRACILKKSLLANNFPW